MKNLVIKNRLKALLLAGIMLTGTGATLSACSKEEANSYSASIDYNSFLSLFAQNYLLSNNLKLV